MDEIWNIIESVSEGVPSYSYLYQNDTKQHLSSVTRRTLLIKYFQVATPRCYSEFNFLQMETGCQLVPKMLSVTVLSGFCPKTITLVVISYEIYKGKKR